MKKSPMKQKQKQKTKTQIQHIQMDKQTNGTTQKRSMNRKTNRQKLQQTIPMRRKKFTSGNITMKMLNLKKMQLKQKEIKQQQQQ